MKIKQFILSVSLLAFIGLSAAAQVKQPKLPEYKPTADPVDDAQSAYEQYDKLREASPALGVGYLKNAKKAIDKAVQDESAAKKPETWAYKALIYSNLALNDSVEAKAKPLYNQAKEAMTKATQLDTKGKQKKNLESAKATLDLFPERISAYTINKGVRDYANKDYPAAYSAFNKALEYRPGDTTITYYAGLSAINAKDYKAGISNYEALTKTGFSANKQIYLDLSRLYAMEGDTAKAISFAAEGAKKFAPNNGELATQEIELSLLSGREKEVISRIEEQAQKNPDNKLYQYYLGLSYATIKDDTKAEAAYKKAIAIDPNYTEATINLGSILLNKGITTYNAANKLPASKQAEYNAQIKKAMDQFEAAFPYLDKATKLDPKSRPAWENLKTYYVVKKNQAKIDEITKTLSTL